jgi:hypothetical protein
VPASGGRHVTEEDHSLKTVKSDENAPAESGGAPWPGGQPAVLAGTSTSNSK